jgi:hypothetical protein
MKSSCHTYVLVNPYQQRVTCKSECTIMDPELARVPTTWYLAAGRHQRTVRASSWTWIHLLAPEYTWLAVILTGHSPIARVAQVFNTPLPPLRSWVGTHALLSTRNTFRASRHSIRLRVASLSAKCMPLRSALQWEPYPGLPYGGNPLPAFPPPTP